MHTKIQMDVIYELQYWYIFANNHIQAKSFVTYLQPLCATKPVAPDMVLLHFRDKNPSLDGTCLQQLNKVQFRRLFTTREIVDKIFKGNRVIVSWMPYSPMCEANAQYILDNEKPTVFADLSNSSGRLDCTSVSFATSYELLMKREPTDIYYRIDVDIYCDSKPLAIQHLHAQVLKQSTLLPRYNGRMCFVFNLNCPLTREDVLDTMEKLGVERQDGFLDAKVPFMLGVLKPINTKHTSKM